MPIPLDSYFLLWVIGIWQPISPAEIVQIIQKLFEKNFEPSNEEEVLRICQKYVKKGLMVRVHRQPSMYSLSLKGHEAIPEKLRHSRDKKRLFLLRDMRRASLRGSRDEVSIGLGDESSSIDTRFRVQGSEARSFASSLVPSGQTIWPRFFQQFFKTGKIASSRDIPYPKFFSFYELAQIPVARDIRQDDPQYPNALKIDIKNLALMMGISPQLIASIINPEHKRHYYRSFTIPKRTGGVRKIDGPRVFLKVIQRFLLDYYLASLKVHSSVNSFMPNKSVLDNAQVHNGKKYVGTIDIKNFFGSITKEKVKKLLAENNYEETEARLISELCTYKDILPQGAPTSPIISNALLYKFDEQMDKLAKEKGLIYSRYADDLTISGDDKKLVVDALEKSEKLLKDDYSLRINEDKTRVISLNGRQVVTGLVVNEKVQLPRYKRHEIRAAFHKASFKDKINAEELNRLRGYYGHLCSVTEPENSESLAKYKEILSALNQKLDD